MRISVERKSKKCKTGDKMCVIIHLHPNHTDWHFSKKLLICQAEFNSWKECGREVSHYVFMCIFFLPSKRKADGMCEPSDPHNTFLHAKMCI